MGGRPLKAPRFLASLALARRIARLSRAVESLGRIASARARRGAASIGGDCVSSRECHHEVLGASGRCSIPTDRPAARHTPPPAPLSSFDFTPPPLSFDLREWCNTTARLGACRCLSFFDLRSRWRGRRCRSSSRRPSSRAPPRPRSGCTGCTGQGAKAPRRETERKRESQGAKKRERSSGRMSRPPLPPSPRLISPLLPFHLVCGNGATLPLGWGRTATFPSFI